MFSEFQTRLEGSDNYNTRGSTGTAHLTKFLAMQPDF